MGQIPLALELDRHASFTCFVAGGNAVAVEHVKAVACGRRGEPVWIFGAAGSGRTHLLSAACRAAAEAGARSMYLDFGAPIEPELVGELEALDFVALDNLERAAGGVLLERALFSVLEARAAGAGRVLMAADRAPRECTFLLPDLASRAAAASVYRLRRLDDEALIEAVEVHAASRGLSFDEAATLYLVQRVSRDLVELTAWLDRIDRFSLAARRRVTLPLIREVIAARAAE